ncbi:chloramphenicol-sensitive protein RarD [Alteribacillus persepolensis]|uniref:Chloramphenicol-sensitive protein RarD n=1 Tax=Alteribacillus persepolensis TaxID=568899 RepID=A0A1G8GFC4_9BACI|nr:EamA family transporter RarD [Alteribacillus persepolensis]SDH92987.1 chloramphenicol-sensitive protein RarD [Alteribacillus persepolensis]
MKENQQLQGVLAAIAAYIIWGFLPLYWKLVGSVPAGEVLAHRIIWALVIMFIILLAIGKWTGVWREIRDVLTSFRKGTAIGLAAIFISLNWFIFIFAVNSDRVIEVSLGYYINPLINVVLATIFLKERLSKAEVFSFILAVAGVLLLTFHYGYMPWAALGLALSFGTYGLIKKMAPIGAWTGLTIETAMMTPFALIFLIVWNDDPAAVFYGSIEMALLLMGAGAATAFPLLLFAAGTKRISFALVGFLQYLAPTIMLVLGIFVFREPFSMEQLLSFAIVWIGLMVFTASRSNATWKLRKQNKIEKNANAS